MQIVRPLARAIVVLLALGAFLAATAQQASAHATFLGAPSARAGEDVRLTLDVPHERDEGIFNTKVRIRLPTGWSSVSCEPFATWTCSTTGTVIEFVKQVGADPAQDETFIFSVRAATAGLALFPVQQIYSSGEDVLWQDTAQLTVSAAVTPTTVVPSGPTTSPSPGQPADSADPAAGPDQPVGRTSDSGESNEQSSGGASNGADGANAATSDQEVAGAADRGVSSSGESGSSLPVILAIVIAAAVAVAASALLALRRRRAAES